MEAEIGVRCLKPKNADDYQWSPEAEEEAGNRPFPWAHKKEPTLRHLHCERLASWAVREWTSII